MSEDGTAALAIRLHQDDTVAVVVQSVDTGSVIAVTGPGDPMSLMAGQPIPCYHKVSLAAAQPGQMLLRNAIVIGRATAPIKAGDWVHTHNLVSLRAAQQKGPAE